jgi:hypothetical protein
MRATQRQHLVVLAFALLATGCTIVDTVQVPSDRSGREIFVTAGDIPEPYESLGFVQAARSGLLLFGFIDVVGTDLQAGFKDVLVPYIRELGGDGAINVRFHQTQYLPTTKAIFALLFIFPLPSQVTLTAEVVKLRRSGAPAAAR